MRGDGEQNLLFRFRCRHGSDETDDGTPAQVCIKSICSESHEIMPWHLHGDNALPSLSAGIQSRARQIQHGDHDTLLATD